MRRFVVAFLVSALAASAARAQVPAGAEFRVNTYTPNDQGAARAAIDASGRFTITWTSNLQDANSFGIYAQRYAPDGAPTGSEFLVPTITSAVEALSNVAYSPGGNSMIVWHGAGSPGFDIHAQRYAPNGTPRGGEFVVNTYTGGNEYRPDVAPLPGGGFVVAWSGHGPGYSFNRIRAQRYDAFGIPLGQELEVTPTAPSVFTNFPSIASAADGRFVIVWEHSSIPTSGIAARLYDASGNPAGPQFFVESMPSSGDWWPETAMAGDGTFVVVWEFPNDGGFNGIRGRVFSASGAPVGAEFTANAGTAGVQTYPAVGANRLGDFVVAWSSQQTTGVYDVIARRFGPTGVPRSGDFRVNTFTTGDQAVEELASDEVGNFVVSWSGAIQDGDFGAFAQRFGGLLPAALAVDPTSSPQSDGNGVLEPGESVAVRPSWRNVNGAAQTFTGTIPLFVGPGATHTITDGAGSYGTVANGATSPCVDCYGVSVSAPNPRPLQHWDAFAEEDIAPDTQGQRKRWRLHVGDSFADVPRSNAFYRFVETLIHHFVTAGCTATEYCPLTLTTREQMAVFVVVARDAAGDPPPECTTPIFNDVPASSGYCRWIEELARSGVVTGCGGGNFCPSASISREEMAVFTLRTLDPALVPPACGTPMFADVPASSGYCRWIEELARRGVVTGCGGGNYCPTAPVTREQMAVFISETFGLTLYGP
jgi:hypothetical protein